MYTFIILVVGLAIGIGVAYLYAKGVIKRPW